MTRFQMSLTERPIRKNDDPLDVHHDFSSLKDVMEQLVLPADYLAEGR
jgi:hypothetical protein